MKKTQQKPNNVRRDAQVGSSSQTVNNVSGQLWFGLILSLDLIIKSILLFYFTSQFSFMHFYVCVRSFSYLFVLFVNHYVFLALQTKNLLLGLIAISYVGSIEFHANK